MSNPRSNEKLSNVDIADRNRLFEKILDHVADPVFVKDRDHRWIYGNSAFWDIMGGEKEQFLGQSDYAFFPKEEADVFWEKDNKVFETGEIDVNEEFLTDARGFKHVISTKKARFSDRGDPVLVGIIRDITALKEMDRMKDDFISMVSHELRTPLTSIRASLELLASEAVNVTADEMRSMVTIALRNTARLERIVNQILELEKIKAGKLPMHIMPIQLEPFISRCIEDNAVYGHKYGVVFEFSAPKEELYALADESSLSQVITNLLSNAAKFSHRDSKVTLTIERHAQASVVIRIKDQGVGIPEEFRSRIFGRFHRAETVNTTQRDGTGLGLNISKQLIEAMNGSIDYESQKGKGSVFCIYLPCPDVI